MCTHTCGGAHMHMHMHMHMCTSHKPHVSCVMGHVACDMYMHM